MSTKHFINDADHLVNAALHSLTFTNPSLAFDEQNKIIHRRPGYTSQVSIISGGGSGHEPSFGAYVGEGFLTAAVAGTIFASPNAEQIYKTIISKVDREKGILVIVMNYTGDVLNFGMAVERAKSSGLNVKMLVVGDDVGVGRARSGKVGRRGIAGTILVQKISGALAARGASLDEVYRVAKLTADNIVSLGASLGHVHVPGREIVGPNPSCALESGKIEIGMGIHNEAGTAQIDISLPELVKIMLAQLLDPNDQDRAFIRIDSTEVVLLVNNLGGVSTLEIGGITSEIIIQLEKSYQIKPIRVLTGTFMSSLNGLGFSISILKIVNTNIEDLSMLQLLDDASEVTGWAAPIRKSTWEREPIAKSRDYSTALTHESQSSGLKLDPQKTKVALTSALQRVIAAEPMLTNFDTVVGDGDCGIGMKRGAESVLNLLSISKFTGDAVLDLSKIVKVVENNMDGTSGALYAIFLNALLQAFSKTTHVGTITHEVWAFALQQACSTLSNYTAARPGDRTVIDALYPFVESFQASHDLIKAAEAARRGSENTKGMRARFGRTVYIGGTGFSEVPDPGAWGLSELLLGLAGVCN
ncbi:BgTH12-01713 [Blumeria graminis f. sp. triticale]|uniref:Bgt-820 n=5 Tax=Blumeria graminis TaxID=34373 RepID=A0A9X9MFC3_BLUGR|nr:BgTH12-01713 [Blumeria graminis f. sp. triticale]VDB83962.1 Bgt-820 [Blumeria graminis f. sp. tritici]